MPWIGQAKVDGDERAKQQGSRIHSGRLEAFDGSPEKYIFETKDPLLGCLFMRMP